MRCPLCYKEIKSGDIVLSCIPSIYDGPNEYNITLEASLLNQIVLIHQKCWQSPGRAVTIPNKNVSEPVEEQQEAIVERSNALELLNI